MLRIHDISVWIRIRIHGISVWIRILGSCLWLMNPDPGEQPGSYFRKLRNQIRDWKNSYPGSGMEKIRIRDGKKHPESAILLWLMDPDPGGPKTYGSDISGSGSASLVTSFRPAIQTAQSLCTVVASFSSVTGDPAVLMLASLLLLMSLCGLHFWFAAVPAVAEVPAVVDIYNC